MISSYFELVPYSSAESKVKWLGWDNPKASTVCTPKQELRHQVPSLHTEQMEIFNGGGDLSSSCFPTSALYRDQANT